MIAEPPPDLHENPRSSAEPSIGRVSYYVKPSVDVNVILKVYTQDSVESDDSIPRIIITERTEPVLFRESTNSSTRADQQSVRIAEFLDTIYLLDSKGDTRLAIDHLLDYIDGLLNKADFAECDDVLRRVDTRKLSDAILVSFLGITKAAQSKLYARASFYMAANSQIATRRGADGADTLLSKYR